MTSRTITKKGGAILWDRNSQWVIKNEKEQPAGDLVRQLLYQPHRAEGQKGVYYIKEVNERYIIVFEESQYLNAVLAVYIPEDTVLGKLKSYRTSFWLVSILAVLFVLFFTTWMYSLVAKPLNKLSGAFKEVERGNLGFGIEHHRHDDFGYVYDRFNKMVRELKSSIQQVFEQKIHTQRAELRQLQYQINPHFLYNSLFLINTMAEEEDYENITVFTDHLKQYYQYITCGNLSQISLEEEFTHARNYISIQSMRFRKRVTVEMEEVPEELKRMQVPRLIIQPVIENAYEHGLKKLISGGRLRIGIMRKEHYLCIAIEDNGRFMGEENLKMLQEMLEYDDDYDSIAKSKGLFNVHRRLNIRFGAESGLRVEQSELGGLKVEMWIHRGEEKGCTSY